MHGDSRIAVGFALVSVPSLKPRDQAFLAVEPYFILSPSQCPPESLHVEVALPRIEEVGMIAYVRIF